MKDFTEAQAVQWVRQEAAKCCTAQQRAARIASEREDMAMFGEDPSLPNSTAAHLALIEVLKQMES